MKIAIVSTDGISVNDHFGRAKRFLIYEAGAAGLKKIEERAVVPLSTGDPSHGFDEERFAAVLAALAGCSRVYATRIGDRPCQELEKRGIIPVIHAGAIDAIPLDA
ncbi:MAG: NifB/NifX family molybdenum-iron cluster-binding protein [Thermodesulfobacteriota bacterium]